jgi:hypothetical protein
MSTRRVVCTLAGLAGLAGLFLAPALTLAQSAQNPQAAPTMKTIGKPSTAKQELINSLIVMNSDGATLEGDKLTLSGVAKNSIVFADRPVRLAGHELTSQLIEEWGAGNSFDKDPPNATVSAFTKDGSQVKDAVVVLKSPKLEGDKLTFTVKVLEGDLTGADGSAAVFIDIFGVWRRAAYRGALYAGAAAGAAAAYGAYGAPYYHPYGYYPPRCGYYPDPPCY